MDEPPVEFFGVSSPFCKKCPSTLPERYEEDNRECVHGSFPSVILGYPGKLQADEAATMPYL
jgi:hypothetical protein